MSAISSATRFERQKKAADNWPKTSLKNMPANERVEDSFISLIKVAIIMIVIMIAFLQ